MVLKTGQKSDNRADVFQMYGLKFIWNVNREKQFTTKCLAHGLTWPRGHSTVGLTRVHEEPDIGPVCFATDPNPHLLLWHRMKTFPRGSAQTLTTKSLTLTVTESHPNWFVDLFSFSLNIIQKDSPEI